ncbi:MAG: glycoside hydrolase family 2 TIM barrel-domain containing protein [Chitinophagaceae bacterium]
MKKSTRQYRLSCALVLLVSIVQAQPGKPEGLNENWLFSKDTLAEPLPSNTTMKWETINLPHTWNKADVLDDVAGYHRGAGWYKKYIRTDTAWHNKAVFLFFEGANQVTDVYVNRRHAGKHSGGYTRFFTPVSRFLNGEKPEEKTELLIKVNNAHDEDIPPLSADFTFYGGIYRDVWLLALDKVHFSVDTLLGSRKFFVETPQVDSQRAALRIRSEVSNTSSSVQKLRLITKLLDNEGKEVTVVSKKIQLAPGKNAALVTTFPELKRPRLWSTTDPYLYRVESFIQTEQGETLDMITAPVGFRWFRFDAEKGFFLNGKSLKLIGTSRHQDYEGMGNAVPAALARKDVELLKEMGGNFLRVAHYPQHSAVLETCDRLGILASVEIPIVNEISETEAFSNNAVQMLKEMLAQNRNHPSLIIWTYMNEVLLKPRFNNDSSRRKIYFSHITALAKKLDSTIRKEDPSRYTMLAHHGDFEGYRSTGLTEVPMLVGWNLYSGWYGGNLSAFPAFLEKHRKALPHKPLLVTEYGADADPRIRSLEPVRFDKSVEYTTQLHQYYLREMMKHPFVAAAMIWNLADFNSETRVETMPHINNKGLLQTDRTPKDPFFFYTAALQNAPYLKIMSGTWKYRTGITDSAASFCTQPVEVASNLDSLELFWNGKNMGKKKVQNFTCSWNVPFQHGTNEALVQGNKNGTQLSDQEHLVFNAIPFRLKDAVPPFKELNILLGGNRYYIDELHKTNWIPAKPYSKGSFGYIGGTPYKMPGNNRLPYGTDKNILHTADDPVYQTQLTGIRSFRLDVPPGKYEIALHFAELTGVQTLDLVYNLEDSPVAERRSPRIFDVLVNNAVFLPSLNIAAEAGIGAALVKTTLCLVSGNEGIHIVFRAIKGDPVLNALRVTKLY